jgi:hypothetical protein
MKNFRVMICPMGKSNFYVVIAAYSTTDAYRSAADMYPDCTIGNIQEC